MGEDAASPDLLEGFLLNGLEIRPRGDQIIGPSGTVHLEPRVMAVLVALAKQPRRTVTRAELMDAVWGDTVVGDEVLSRAVSLLRTALGDERTNPRFIRTVPRRGYELVADLSPLRTPTPEQATTRRGRYLVGALAVLALVVAGATTLWLSTPDEPISLAVIPLDTSRLPEADRYSGDAIADQLIRRLTEVDALSVIARRSSFQLRDAALDIRDVGHALDARYLIEGSLAGDDDGLQVTLYLVDSTRGTNLWTTTLEGADTDLYALGDAAYGAVIEALARHLGISAPQPRRPAETGATHAGPAEAPPNDTGLADPAYRRYLEAKYQWSLRGESRLQRAVSLLEESIRLKPDLALAHLALAEAVAALPFYTTQPVAPAFARARTQLAEAVTLDPSLQADADALEGMMLMREQTWPAARQRLEQALRRNPDSVYGHYWYSMLLSSLGDYRTALVHIQRAQRLDPVSAVINDRLALAYTYTNDLAAARARYRESAKLGYLESTQPKALALFYYRTGQYERIRELLERIGLAGAWLDALVAALRQPADRAHHVEQIDAAIRRGEVPREFWFGIWILLRQADQAFRDFDASPKTQDIEVLWIDEAAFLRADPRFDQLLERVQLRGLPGLPKYG